MSCMKFLGAYVNCLEIEIILLLEICLGGGWELKIPQSTTAEVNQHKSHHR